MPSLTFVAFSLLAARKDRPVLVIERSADVLQTHPSQTLRALFGVEISAENALPFDENLLATNPVPAIWLASDSASLPENTIAGCVFHAPLKKADRAEHARPVRLRVKKLKLSKAATAEILKLDVVSSAQLESAVKAARLAGTNSKADCDAAVVQAIRRSQKALSCDLTERHKASVTAYSLGALFLDEADSFLQSREHASAGWEVTSMNCCKKWSASTVS